MVQSVRRPFVAWLVVEALVALRGGERPFYSLSLRLQADVESGRFEARRVVHGRLHGGRRLPWDETMLVRLCSEWFGEGLVVAAGLVEVVGGVDESGRWWSLAGGPGVPGVESLLCGSESVPVAVEAAGELPVDLELLLQPVVFRSELIALVEQRPGAGG